MNTYLTPGEARAKLGISRRTFARRVSAGDVPGVRLARGLIRIEGHYADPTTPDPSPPAQGMTLSELAQWLRVRPRTLVAAVRSGDLATEIHEASRALDESIARLRRGDAASAEASVRRAATILSQLSSSATPRFSRRAILRWLNDHALEAAPEHARASRPTQPAPATTPIGRSAARRGSPSAKPAKPELPPLLRWLASQR